MSKLKQFRERQNLTQEELFQSSGISVRTIQRIEAGIRPKGHTLKALSKALDISAKELLDDDSAIESTPTSDTVSHDIQAEPPVDYSRIKLINLSSVLFVVIPPLNILAPFVLAKVFRQENTLSKQIISLQILYTILAPVLFMLAILLKPGRSFTVLVMVLIVIGNIFLIIRNLSEIDRNQKLRYKLSFSIL